MGTRGGTGGSSRWVTAGVGRRAWCPEGLGFEHGICSLSPSRLQSYAFPDENKAWLKKIEKLDEPSHYSKHRLEPRRTDVDMNNHLNYVTYMGWILESISEIINNYELQSLTIDFKQECRLGDIIDSLAIRESNDDHHDGLLRFRHSLRRLSSNGSETTRATTVWRKKTEKR
ncbi:hypothetical protein CASFOL_040253 [Castilleja foliolosa]|uniref:Acyl-ACP thioesterase-like C-terminal domain-containing protein n=1 Tax=Castilleja foliolosa TaxID=1961234 RepID=A0ABD3BFA9_9LAMI